MIFKNNGHEQRYYEILGRMTCRDEYHTSAAYLMALVDYMQVDDIFDFKEDAINHSGLGKAWQTQSSKKATRLMFNLWNGCISDSPSQDENAQFYAVDEIFSNTEYAPYFYEAVKIRFGQL